MLQQLPWALSSFFIQPRACSALPSTTLNAIPRYNPILRPFDGKFSNCRQIMLNSIHHSTRCTTFFCRWQIKWMGLCGCMGWPTKHIFCCQFSQICVFCPLWVSGHAAKGKSKNWMKKSLVQFWQNLWILTNFDIRRKLEKWRQKGLMKFMVRRKRRIDMLELATFALMFLF